ncbi:alpha/beta hydrolase [Streptomyces sp. NBC_01433]|uniref:alpha/beta hydrolase n=1 Tax=Streptomyces sp. NBC_01433 TaxID=2903864 RepID=UPI002257F8C3|nr:alpha/beta fold hydrolase [Streptomyces sp. NBC_01433]MCX4674348.1 alpha/beta hydrolase [Streptomyces sp. NBC_01433]
MTQPLTPPPPVTGPGAPAASGGVSGASGAPGAPGTPDAPVTPAASRAPDGPVAPDAPGTLDTTVAGIELDADGLTLSGLLALPRTADPRAVVVALHGGGMRAGYFHGQADPATSLLSLAADCGYAALALDRPGYGRSAREAPDGMGLAGQAERLRAALAAYGREHPTGAGFFLVGHSLGGKVALATAAGWSTDGLPGTDGLLGADRLLGLDVSGVSDRWAVTPGRLTGTDGRQRHTLHWGPPSLYPPDTFRLARPLIAPMPPNEAAEAARWPGTYAELAPSVRVPVRLTFAEHERWWHIDPPTLAAMTARLGSPLVRTEHLADAGHNISLGLAARSYHLRVLAFLEECLGRSRRPVPVRGGG